MKTNLYYTLYLGVIFELSTTIFTNQLPIRFQTKNADLILVLEKGAIQVFGS